jgi:hypothetical protein
MSIDVVFTAVIVAAAAAWAGRRLWRSVRRRASSKATPGCGDQPGGCADCHAVGPELRTAPGSKDDAPPCGDGRSTES